MKRIPEAGPPEGSRTRSRIDSSHSNDSNDSASDSPPSSPRLEISDEQKREMVRALLIGAGFGQFPQDMDKASLLVYPSPVNLTGQTARDARSIFVTLTVLMRCCRYLGKWSLVTISSFDH